MRFGQYNLAEMVGFEPTDLFTQIDGLANRCLRPLSHISIQLVAGVGFEPHDFWLMRPARTTASLTRNKTGGPNGIRTRDLLRDRQAY